MSSFKIKNNDWGSDLTQETFIKEYYNTTPDLNLSTCLPKEPKVKSNKKKRNSKILNHQYNDSSDLPSSNKKSKTCDETSKMQKFDGKSCFSKNIYPKNIMHAKESSKLEDDTSKTKKKRRNRLKNKLKVQRPLLNLKLSDISKKKTFAQQNSLEQHQLQPTRKEVSKSINNETASKYKLSNKDSLVTGVNMRNLFSQRSILLKEKATKAIQAAKFRLLNEKLYSVTGQSASKLFQHDSDSFHAYHQGFQNQVSKWPVNPLDIIIKDLRQYPNELVIADLGCGDAKIAQTFTKRKVFSFDLVALNDCVICCDISKVPLQNNTVDIVIFCLSLMGTNLSDYILEAHRILKSRGLMKIAEVESRFDDLNDFIKSIEAHGFTLKSQDIGHKMFVLLDFNKVKKNVKTKDLPTINLSPCLYKKR